jgi:hypothetical protein
MGCRVNHWLVRFLVRVLEPVDREVVLGDVAEYDRGLGRLFTMS